MAGKRKRAVADDGGREPLDNNELLARAYDVEPNLEARYSKQIVEWGRNVATMAGVRAPASAHTLSHTTAAHSPAPRLNVYNATTPWQPHRGDHLP